MVIFKMENHRV